MKIDISVIVPVYQVEKYISKCLKSLFEQTFSNAEYIFVDDCGDDKSISILEEIRSEYPFLKGRIHILRHSENRGVASARNSGLAMATGEYVTFCDADDWIEKNMLEKMFVAIQLHNADILWCDFYNSYQQYETYIIQPKLSSSDDCIKALLSEKMHGALWNKLVKRTLYTEHHISFADDLNMWEDLRVVIQLFSYAQQIVYLNQAFYHYVQYNSNALSRGNNEKRQSETFQNAEAIIKFLKNRKSSTEYEPYFNYLKFAAKQTLLFAADKRNFIKWRQTYPESNDCALSFKVLPLHLRLLAWSAANGIWPVIYIWISFKKIKNKIKGVRR